MKKHVRKIEKYSVIREKYLPDVDVPDAFFQPVMGNEDYCIFYISCLGKDRFLYMDDYFREFSGYPNEQFIKGSMDFWFSLICPDDMEAVSAAIIESHKGLMSISLDKEKPKPLVLTYRFKHADGHWVAIQDTRYLVSFNENKVIDKVLCRFETMPEQQTPANDLDELLKKEKSCTRLLETAIVFQEAKNKQPFDSHEVNPSPTPLFGGLTKREKEILRLIGEGLSTKMIADKCSISVHTVESHRKHLLEKLDAKNSMELIGKASKVFRF
jgi:DNA-binding CsgD family transcriptional regulator